MLGAVMFGHRSFQPVIDAIIELAEACAKEPMELPATPAGSKNWPRAVRELAEADLREAYGETGEGGAAREGGRGQAARQAVGWPTTRALDADAGLRAFDELFKDLEKDVVRRRILDERPPYRRPRHADGPADRRARSACCRGRTAARCSPAARPRRWCVTTLGTGQDEQIIDALDGEYREHFMLHYNFPPYSVGEAGRFGFTGRREVGHGKLAWRAIRRCCRPRRTSPTPSASSPRSPSPTAPRRWRPSAAPRCR